ncbi:hypothetical protein [Psychrobacter sp. I-STPA10]|uniref:hypothetical protein n=1 Tax=Psychrobacter sp. I-STPA10 TaxID=2585769 RepID=UPI001E49582B|nr:hypothetical protein [Psychrobacter sp. I-STPA10]
MNKSVFTALSFVCVMGATSVQAIAAQPLATNQIPPMPNYQLLLVSPSTDSAYHKPAQNIDVNVQVRPNLRAFDKVVISMNGKPVAEGLTATIPTIGFNPGEYTLSVLVQNSQTGAQSASVSSKVYIIQNTHVRQQKQAIAEQIAAYNRLPWYKKAYVRLRQDDKSIPTSAKKTLPPAIGSNQHGNKGSAF